MQFFTSQQVLASARIAVRPALMLSMGGTALGGVLFVSAQFLSA